ncbi:MAG: TetR/AcrR family transcriptional regulator [Eubacterium sp.]|nr:TetR/AcrR family transcriptional regulator [Eubacterium sp.]
MELKERIMEGAVTCFQEKGIKFTMDDLAEKLGMSKKTIYTVVEGKDELLVEMVEHVFASIKESEEDVLWDENLTTVDKIRKILGVFPDAYRDINFQGVFELRDKYPEIYSIVEERLETGWEATIALLEQGMTEGVIRKINIPIFKMMFEASLEQFFKRDILQRNGISYQDALEEVVEILVDGIVA